MRDPRELLIEAANMPETHEKVTLLEEAVRLADLALDEEAAFDARDELVEAATDTGEGEKALAAFAWCLAYHDRHPDRVDSEFLYWKYKWMLSAAPRFPQLPLSRIRELHEDYARRLRTQGYRLRSVPYAELRLAMHLGDAPRAVTHHAAWRRTKRDELSDCEACEANTEVEYQLLLKRDERAVEAARPILQGHLSCNVVPRRTYALLLDPLVRLGRLDEARRYHALGYPLVAAEDKYLEERAQHLGYLALVGELDGALRLYARHVGWALRSRELARTFAFWGAALRWLDALTAAGQDRVTLELPGHHPLHQPGPTCEVAALRAWHEREAQALAQRFDARNGTDAFSRRLRAWRSPRSPQPAEPR